MQQPTFYSIKIEWSVNPYNIVVSILIEVLIHIEVLIPIEVFIHIEVLIPIRPTVECHMEYDEEVIHSW